MGTFETMSLNPNKVEKAGNNGTHGTIQDYMEPYKLHGNLFPKLVRKSQHFWIICIQFPFIMGNYTF